jgi:hypothetical protein
MGSIIFKLTDQRKNHEANIFGQLKQGIKVVDSFDPEIRNFISSYLLRGRRKDWVELTCRITFKHYGKNMEMFLSVDPKSRSQIDIATFPSQFVHDLDCDWRSLLGRSRMKKRSNEEMTPHVTPSKKPCDPKNLSPMIKSLIQQSMPNADPQAIGLTALSVGKEIAQSCNILENKITEALGKYDLELVSITTALTKTIQNLINKRNQYHQSVNQNPLMRTNKITAMIKAKKAAEVQKTRCLTLVANLNEALITEHHNQLNLIQFVVIREKDEKPTSLSTHQASLIRLKIHVVSRLMELMGVKYEKKIQLIDSTFSRMNQQSNDQGRDNEIIAYDDAFIDWKKEYNVPILIANLQKAIFHKHSPQTLLRWVNDFKSSGDIGWRLDLRGSYCRDFTLEMYLINDISLATRLEGYIRFQPSITVKSCQEWLKTLIRENFATDSEIMNFPIAESTCLRWMKKIGSKFEANKKSYYNDTHESPRNIEYRKKYIEHHERLSLRQPVWVYIAENQASLEAKEDAKRRTSLNVLPVEVINEVDNIKVHMDFLQDDEHLTYRRQCMDTIKLPGLLYYDPYDPNFAQPCAYDHPPGICKCDLPILHVGHDEKIWHADSIPKNGWTIKGFRKLLKKGAAVGVMTSGFVDSERGFGISLSPEEMVAINENNGRENEIVNKNPGFLFFEYGVNREGYWNHDLFSKQIEAMIDSLEYIYPSY